MLRRNGSHGADVEILDRAGDPAESTYPTEVVTCRIGDGPAVQLFCKYSRPRRCQLPLWHAAYGHRHGVAYEARVYEHVLEPLPMTTARLFGTYYGPNGRAWVVLEHLEGRIRATKMPSGTEQAAAWLGQFHARNETRLADPAIRFLCTYTADFYRGWARRTLRYAQRFRRDCRPIAALCERFDAAIAVLLEPPLTIIHSEYYPANVLYLRDAVYPVDWESTAIAAGEIDLVQFTENWGAAMIRRCEAAYARARWPSRGTDAAFQRRLAAARLFTLLKWTGSPRSWKSRDSREHYLNCLIAESRRRC